MPDQSDRATCRNVEVDVAEHGPAGEVLERDVLEADRPVAGRQRACGGRVRNLLGLVDHLEDALAGGGRALGLADPHAERTQRHDEHGEVEVERHEAAGRERSVRDHARAGEEHRGLREQRHERDQRHICRALAVRTKRLPEDVLRAAVELAVSITVTHRLVLLCLDPPWPGLTPPSTSFTHALETWMPGIRRA